MFKSRKLFHSSHDLRRKKESTKRRVTFAICIFSVLALVSSVYAAQSGWFVFRGVVARTQNMDVRFANAQFIGLPRNGESIVISTANDYKSFSISAQLMMPGDSRAVQFQVQNIGNQAVRLLNISTTQDNSQTTGLVVQWPDDIPESPNLTNYVLIPESMSDTFLIYISWDSSATSVQAGQFRYFTLTMKYQNALLPISINFDQYLPLYVKEYLA